MSNKTGRNAGAVAAQFRNSAGSMKDKREDRGGAHNFTRDLRAEYDQEQNDTLEENASTFDLMDVESDADFGMFDGDDSFYDDDDYDDYPQSFYDYDDCGDE